MAGIVRDDIRAHHKEAHRRLAAADRLWNLVDAFADASHHPGVVDADFGIVGRRWRSQNAAQRTALAVRVTVDEKAHHIGHVFLGTGQPILQRQKIRAHILRGSRNEAQQLGQPAQHLHLAGPGAGGFSLAAAQSFEQRHRAARRRAHVETAHAGQFGDFPRRHRAYHRVAAIAAGAEGREERNEMILEKQHHANDDVAARDVGATTLQSMRINREFRSGVDAERQSRDLSRETCTGAIGRARDMRIHGDDDNPYGYCVIARNGLLHRTMSQL